MKIFLFDVETAPTLAHVWQAWKANISINQVMEHGYVLCWAGKWLGEDEVIYASLNEHGEQTMLESLHELLTEADIIVAHNGNKFDIPVMNTAFLKAGMKPPAPSKQIDTLAEAKKHFRFFHNKLDYLGEFLGVGRKVEHEGHELWVKVMNGDQEAWDRMIDYNVQDVQLLEQVYLKLRPWMKTHPSIPQMDEDEHYCPRCGSKHIHFRGYITTRVSEFRRFQCQDCGGWGRVRLSENTKEDRRSITMPV